MGKKRSGKQPHTKFRTIQEIAEQEFPDPNRKKLFTMPNKLIGVPDKVTTTTDAPLMHDQTHYKELDALHKKYNEKLSDIDPDYGNLEPYAHVIVRCKVLQMTKQGSIFIPNTIPVGELTQNGMGIRKTLESPWSFSTEAIIISSPTHYKERYPQGTRIQISKECVIPTKAGVDQPFELTYAFTRPEWWDYTPPTSPEDKHFGYLRLPIDKIICKL